MTESLQSTMDVVRRPKILLAEDDELSQKMLKLILSRKGYDVVCVSNGAEALEYIETQKPDLVILDIQMPIMDGMETCKRIRLRESGKEHLPILALTASVSWVYESTHRETLFDEFIGKPFEPKRILEIIKRYTRQSAASKSETLPNARVYESNLILDWSGASSQYGADQETFKELFKEFLLSLPARLELMQIDLKNKNMAALSNKAHNLKGISANFGAMLLSDFSAHLDRESGDGHEKEAEQTLQKISGNVETLIEHSRALFNWDISEMR